MTEASRGRVTITLGHSGQVVKRDVPVSDVGFSDSVSSSGSKRSVRDRLGSNVDSSVMRGSQLNNKRQRGNGHTASSNSNVYDDVQVDKDDLRYKLMQKNMFRRTQSDDDQVMDLREKLSKTGQPPLNSYDARQRISDSRERLPNQMQRMPESRETSILSTVPSTRRADALPHMTSSRTSFSPWTLEHLRKRSPDRVMGTPRGLSPPRNVEGLQRGPLTRTFDDMRTAVPYMGKDILEAPRPVSTTFVAKPTFPTTSSKPMPPGPPPIPSAIPPPSGILQKSSFAVDEQLTVEGLLHTLGLGKYVITFKAEEVDMTALKQMGENDLKELGIPMGPRKKILLALLPRSKRQP